MAEEKNPQAVQNTGDILKIRRDKLAALQEAGQDPFQQTKYDFNCTTAKVRAEFDALEGTVVRLAGRMMSKRVMGKVSFCDLQDSAGRLQLYVRRDELGDEVYHPVERGHRGGLDVEHTNNAVLDHQEADGLDADTCAAASDAAVALLDQVTAAAGEAHAHTGYGHQRNAVGSGHRVANYGVGVNHFLDLGYALLQKLGHRGLHLFHHCPSFPERRPSRPCPHFV